MTAYLIRRYFPTHTTGALVAIDAAGNLVHSCVTLELPWRDNAPQVSCIPEGIYHVEHRETDKFGHHYHVQGIAGREWILFHPGTYTSQLRGCIIPGRRFRDLNADGIPDILDTRKTLDAMLLALGQSFTLHILTAPLDGGALPTVEVTA
jgi:hypothetical protein